MPAWKLTDEYGSGYPALASSALASIVFADRVAPATSPTPATIDVQASGAGMAPLGALLGVATIDVRITLAEANGALSVSFTSTGGSSTPAIVAGLAGKVPLFGPGMIDDAHVDGMTTVAKTDPGGTAPATDAFTFTTVLALGPHQLQLTGTVPAADDFCIISGDFTGVGVQLKDVGRLMGSLGSDSTHGWFPAADLGAFLPATPAFSLLGLRVGLYVASDPWTVTVSYMSVGIGITGQPLLAEKLYLNPFGVWITVLNPLSSADAPALVAWSIDGSLAVCSATRPGDFQHPDCVFDFGINPTSWSLYGRLENPDQTPVKTLIADLVGTGTDVGIPDTLTVDGFDFSASVDRDKGTMGPFTTNVLMSGGFGLFSGGSVQLQSISVQISYTP